jgi:hypothetical protein
MQRDDIGARIHELLQAQANAKLVTAEKLHHRWSEMFEADIATSYRPPDHLNQSVKLDIQNSEASFAKYMVRSPKPPNARSLSV